MNIAYDLFLNQEGIAGVDFSTWNAHFIVNHHTFSTKYKPESNLADDMLFGGEKPRGECPGGDIEWLSIWVMILGNNSGLLSFACCLKAGKRIKMAFSGFFMVFLLKLSRLKIAMCYFCLQMDIVEFGLGMVILV